MSRYIKKAGFTFIDSDIHPSVRSIEKLYPYISSEWKRRFEFQKIDISKLRLPDRYVHPAGGVIRADASSPDGGEAASDPFYTREHYLEALKPEKTVLIALQPASTVSWTNVETVNTLVSAFNDYFVNEWVKADSRYTYAICAIPHDPQKAVAEIKRLGKEKGVSAIYLPLLNIRMGSSYYYPIYEAAIEHGLPIITHVSGQEASFQGSPTLASGDPLSYIERYVDLTQLAQANVCSLIFEGVFEKYPELKIGFVEYGFSWLLSLTWRMNKAWKGLRIETPWVKHLPSEYIRKHMRFTTQPIDEPEKISNLYCLMDQIHGEDILMYSSDYPHWDNDMPDRVLQGLSNEVKSKIYYENAKDFYRF